MADFCSEKTSETAPLFCRDVYLAQISDFCLILNMSFACMLGTWSPKRNSFCEKMPICHFPAFSSLSHQLSWRTTPSFLQGNQFIMVHLYTSICCFVLLQCWRRVKFFVSSSTMKGSRHINWWGATCALNAPPIVKFPSITFHIYKDVLNGSTP